MRQIDDMTPQEIETLHLKGMLRKPTAAWIETPTACFLVGKTEQEWDASRERDRDLEFESRQAEEQTEHDCAGCGEHFSTCICPVEAQREMEGEQ